MLKWFSDVKLFPLEKSEEAIEEWVITDLRKLILFLTFSVLDKRKKASNLVDVDGDVVQGGGLSSDAKALVVEFHRIWEFLLLQEVVSFASVLVKLHRVEPLLHPLHRGSHNWVLWI